MVQAILAGRKTQTRRILKPQPGSPQVIARDAASPSGYSLVCDTYEDEHLKHRYGKVGDILWVRETFAGDDLCGYVYRADHPDADLKMGDLDDGEVQIRNWQPSIHMPRVACRLFLRIKNIRVERLHDISGSDAINEGVDHRFKMRFEMGETDALGSHEEQAKHAFGSLWREINGNDSWFANPWVWVIEFEKVDMP